MNKIPFEYGSIAENEYFIGRIEDRKDLKTFLGGGINVMLISPRRWGKSSLVKAAMEELKQEQKDIRVCYLDAVKFKLVLRMFAVIKRGTPYVETDAYKN